MKLKQISVWQWLSWLSWNPYNTKSKRDKIAAALFKNMGLPMTEREISKAANIKNRNIGQSVRDLRRFRVMGNKVLDIRTTKVKELGEIVPAYYIYRD